MRVRVAVDDLRCQGHTMCNLIAPQIFSLQDEDGHSVVLQREVDGPLAELARKAAAGCPEQAIDVTEIEEVS